MSKFFLWVEYQMTTGVVISVEADTPAQAQARLLEMMSSMPEPDDEQHNRELDALHEVFDRGEVQSAGISKVEFFDGDDYRADYDMGPGLGDRFEDRPKDFGKIPFPKALDSNNYPPGYFGD